MSGNETETAAWSAANDYGTKDVTEIAVKIANEPKKGDRKRMVILTQGAGDYVCVKDGVVSKHPITVLKKSEIHDTNGAGDAFVGGGFRTWGPPRGRRD